VPQLEEQALTGKATMAEVSDLVQARRCPGSFPPRADAISLIIRSAAVLIVAVRHGQSLT